MKLEPIRDHALCLSAKFGMTLMKEADVHLQCNMLFKLLKT